MRNYKSYEMEINELKSTIYTYKMFLDLSDCFNYYVRVNNKNLFNDATDYCEQQRRKIVKGTFINPYLKNKQ